MVKNLPAMQETWVRSLGWEDCRRVWQPTAVFLPGESLWTEELGRLHSMGSQRIGHDWVIKYTAQIILNISLKGSLFIARYFGSSTGRLLSFFINFVSKEVGRKVLSTWLETASLRTLGLTVKITAWCSVLLVHSTEPQRAAKSIFQGSYWFGLLGDMHDGPCFLNLT